MHCCGPLHEDERLSIKISDGGGGPYLVVNASEWSLASEEDIDELCMKLKAALVTANEQQKGEEVEQILDYKTKEAILMAQIKKTMGDFDDDE